MIVDRLTIDRGLSTDQGTLGAASLHNVAGVELWQARSLELPWRNNASDRSCIPAGVYVAKIQQSPRFGYLVYVLQNVPARANCEMHDGNYAGDISLGWKSDVEGCTVFGTDTGTLTPVGMRPQTAVLHSDVARRALIAATGGADIEVEYRWTSGNEPS